MDVFAPGIVIGVGCCWGRECDLHGGVRFRSDFTAWVPLDKSLHPVQLYESAVDIIPFFIFDRCVPKSTASAKSSAGIWSSIQPSASV